MGIAILKPEITIPRLGITVPKPEIAIPKPGITILEPEIALSGLRIAIINAKYTIQNAKSSQAKRSFLKFLSKIAFFKTDAGRNAAQTGVLKAAAGT